MKKLKVSELVLYALLGTVMFISKMVTEFLPNVHFLAMLTVAYTAVFRIKALIPIYVFVILTGAMNGFSLWWLPYLYIWAVLWAAAMCLPRNMPKKAAVPAYMVVAAMHGFLYGTLYAPAQALMFGLDFNQTVGWIMAGLPWDAVHGVGNLLAGTLVVPVIRVLKFAKRQINI